MSITTGKYINFFDRYPQFTKTGAAASLARLNRRYIALIESNKEIIKDRTVLDIASHDGRWSFAALECGAAKVIGIEAREEAIEQAEKNMALYDVGADRYDFILGDVHAEIQKVEEKIDIVFLFGFLYHTMKHYELLEGIDRLDPDYLIIDSNVFYTNISAEIPLIMLVREPSSDPLFAVSDQEYALVGLPNKFAINEFLDYLGYSFEYFDWNTIEPHVNVKQYYVGKRVSVLATKKR